MAISLVSIVAFSTMIYSAYEEFLVLTNASSGLKIGLSQHLSGTNFVLDVNGTVPNNGLYPIEFDGTYAASASGILLGKANLLPVSLPPGARRTFSDSVSIDFLGTNDTGTLRGILLNGTMVTIAENITFRLQPFAGLTVSNASSLPFPPLMGNFEVGQPSKTTLGGVTSIVLPLSFVDQNVIGFPYRMYVEFFRGSAMVANSTVALGFANPGMATAVQTRSSTSSAVPQGPYHAVLHVLLDSRNVPIPFEVSLP
jgi:hypothetical protein